MPAPTPTELRRDFLKVLVLPALTFLLVPILALGFTRYGTGRIDEEILAAVERAIDRDDSIAVEDRPRLKAEWRAHPPSAICQEAAPEAAGLRARLCAPYGELWQFTWRAAWPSWRRCSGSAPSPPSACSGWSPSAAGAPSTGASWSAGAPWWR